MPPKPLTIDSLELDLENPRITLASDQRDAMQKILNEQRVKLINLAESIAVRGVNPMDRFLVLKSSKQDKFIVIEGNRRILAIKLLHNPSLIDDLEMAETFRKRLHKAAQNFDIKSVEQADCFEVTDRAEGIDWVRQRHMGEDAGRGVVDWSGLASSRFRGRDPALQALDFVLQHASLTEDQKDQIATGKFITTLDRLLSTPSVRSAIGFEIDKGKLMTELPPEEALKPLKRIVLDLAEKKINVTRLKSKEQQNDYIEALKSADRPDLSKKSGTAIAIEAVKDSDFGAKPSPGGKRKRAGKTTPRTTVVPRNCKLKIPVTKIAGIFGELRSLQLSKHKHAIAVLLRVFLEMSVDEYLVKKASSKLTFIPPKSTRSVDKTLKVKVQETITHLVANGANARDFIGVTRGLADANHPFSIDTLHAYIHNRYFTPIDTHLTAAWDNAQPFFEKLWP
jgi:hypothetical protein